MKLDQHQKLIVKEKILKIYPFIKNIVISNEGFVDADFTMCKHCIGDFKKDFKKNMDVIFHEL
jgi:hypothetical protein